MLQKLFIFSIVLLAFISCSHTISREQKEVDKPKELNIKDSAYRIEGKFFLVEGKSVYDSFDFKGKSTVVINSFGLDFVTTYTKDEEYLRIDANPTDILLKIHSKEMIEGEGFASGIFVKDSLLKTKQRQHEEEPIKKSVPSNNIQENPVKRNRMFGKMMLLKEQKKKLMELIRWRVRLVSVVPKEITRVMPKPVQAIREVRSEIRIMVRMMASADMVRST